MNQKQISMLNIIRYRMVANCNLLCNSLYFIGVIYFFYIQYFFMIELLEKNLLFYYDLKKIEKKS